jgi:hypothetical protein
MRVSKAGGPAEVVLTGYVVTSIAIDGELIYFTTSKPRSAIWEFGDGDVLALDKRTPGAAPFMLAADAGSPQGITFDAHHVYWRVLWVHTRVRTHAPRDRRQRSRRSHR